MTDQDKEKAWKEHLDEMYPLDGLNCCPFSQLLKRGDETTYWLGLEEFGDNLEDTG